MKTQEKYTVQAETFHDAVMQTPFKDRTEIHIIEDDIPRVRAKLDYLMRMSNPGSTASRDARKVHDAISAAIDGCIPDDDIIAGVLLDYGDDRVSSSKTVGVIAKGDGYYLVFGFKFQ
jgi:hypothetical protein